MIKIISLWCLSPFIWQWVLPMYLWLTVVIAPHRCPTQEWGHCILCFTPSLPFYFTLPGLFPSVFCCDFCPSSWICLPWTPSLVALGIRPCSREPLYPIDVLTDPVLPAMVNPWPQPCSVCHSPSLAVLLLAWKPGYRGRSKEGELLQVCFYPLYWAFLGCGAVGMVTVPAKWPLSTEERATSLRCWESWVWWDGD